jgi:tRNA modification GTPase
MTSTIFALASGSMRAGVAVVRVSGPAAAKTFQTLANEDLPAPRMAHLVTLQDGGALLDRALALWFKSPASFTGEDVVEYHLHGGRAVVEGVLRALGKIPGCRMAEPGEFTRRAFENGKMDLTEAEAVADLIDAETEAQRDQALSQLHGSLSKLYSGWADALKNILAHQEADIEFPDEDMPSGISEGLKPGIEKLRGEIAAHLDDGRRGERLREGVRVAIVGAPNAGKSSLLNALARREAAIVSDEAGTTRDVIEAHLDLGGFPVIVADTAGLRAPKDKIEVGKVEAEGIRRAKAAAADADIRIALFDSAAPQDRETLALVDDRTMVAFSKSDLGGEAKAGAFRISSRTGEGMDEFLNALTQRAASLFGTRSGPALTRTRHRAALEETQNCLARGLEAKLPELAAEDLRLALRALGRITGKVHVEELLDAVFRDFCIGK